MEDVQIVIYDGFDELDAVAPFEILSGAGFRTSLVTLGRTATVRAAHGMTITPDGALGPSPDLLVVPGGGWAARAAQGAWAEVQRGDLPAAIAERHASGTVLAGVCSGAMIVAASGVLRGRPAVTHHTALDELGDYGAEARPEARVVDDGDVLTAGGVTSAIDLALHVVARERGEAAATAGARWIEYERRGPVVGSRGRVQE
jgi:transcriptional regulator GlxA family with amidase domain